MTRSTPTENGFRPRRAPTFSNRIPIDIRQLEFPAESKPSSNRCRRRESTEDSSDRELRQNFPEVFGETAVPKHPAEFP